ncbi:MAG: hypothetical protein IJU62_05315 [Muribaculaceae bacterium]|nr:hypothetical protein [Muribaculaceae bacterium]
MEDLVITIPSQDAELIESLSARMGWLIRKRRTSVERFISSCATCASQMSDDEIQAEVNAVRRGE